MRGLWAGALFIVVMVALFVWGVLGIPGGEHRLDKCWEANEDVMVLMFRNERGGHKHISFSNRGKFSTVKSNWTKYAVDWNKSQPSTPSCVEARPASFISQSSSSTDRPSLSA